MIKRISIVKKRCWIERVGRDWVCIFITGSGTEIKSMVYPFIWMALKDMIFQLVKLVDSK